MYVRAAQESVNLDPAIQLALRHQQSGRTTEAERLCRELLVRQPRNVQALQLLGQLAHQAGRHGEAVELMRRVLETDRKNPYFHGNLGAVLAAGGRLGEAEQLLKGAVRIKPDYVEAHSNLGNVLLQSGKVPEAIESYQKALKLRPNAPECHYNLGTALQRARRAGEAIAEYERAIALKPEFADAHNNIGSIHSQSGRLDPGIAAFRAALRANPRHVGALNNLGAALQEKGEIDEAIAIYRRALAVQPDPRVEGNLIVCMHLRPEDDPAAIRAEVDRWNQAYARPLASMRLAHTNPPDPEKRLRIGYVSRDFNRAPVGRFMVPLLSRHDHERFEIFAYSDVVDPDPVTDRLRGACDHWRDTAVLNDAQLAERIRQDGIDILVDLGMHTKNSRILVFAMKPAPVQVSYLAYCSTTGLETMDYRVTDWFLDPPDRDPALYSEQSLQLTSYWCYAPPAEAPDVVPPPSRSNGFVTFGCLNNFCKISRPAFETWCRILKAAPNSRLMLHALEGSHRQFALERVSEAGIDPARVQFVDRLPVAQYLRQYNFIDVALDPFPYPGGTTSCDALWMGVPLVTLAGRMAIARGGVSILSNIGLPELVARSRDEYVQVAVGLASDGGRLAQLRSSLQQRMGSSPLMDGARLTREMESAYREIWRRWCGGRGAGPVTTGRNTDQAYAVASGLHRSGSLAEAEAVYRQILSTEPNHAAALYGLGTALIDLGRSREAVGIFRLLLETSPSVPEAHYNLGRALRGAGDLEGAIKSYRKSLELRPDFAEAWNNLGSSLKQIGRTDDALAAYRKAIDLRPSEIEPRYNLGNALAEAGDVGEAVELYRSALAIRPDTPHVIAALGNALRESGDTGAALDCYRRSLAIAPDPDVASNLAYTLYLDPASQPGEIVEAHQNWDRQFAQPLSDQIRPHLNDRSPTRRIRIGYVSPDLSLHPVGRFMRPLLSDHDREGFEVFCYSDGPADQLTVALRHGADGWRETGRLSHAQLAEQIRQDRIDVLVDLAMHTRHNRLLAFARKPAPVQLSYLAYCGTTGLRAIDYRLTDPYLDPPDQVEGAYTERSVRLPQTYWCFQPVEQMPEVQALPAATTGFVTFGYLGSFAKASRPATDAWLKILEATPGSRILIHSPLGPHRDRLIAAAGSRGINKDRVEFANRTSLADYFRQFSRIDVMLDSFPCSGATVICDSLWMGVPVVTLAGRTAMGRSGLSVLSNAGLPEFAARDVDGYVRLAADLAIDVDRLESLRSTLRNRMVESPLMDSRQFTRDFEAAVRAMWRNWCEGTR